MKMFKPWYVLTPLLIASMFGCAEQKPVATVYEDNTPSQADIVGGTDSSYESIDDASVVFISTENSHGQNMVCTGTFISKNFILTAKHCISRRGVNSMSVSFRKKTFLKDQDLVDIPMKEVYKLDFSVLHEAQIKKGDILFTDEGKLHDDLGIIEFSGGLPDGAKIALFPKDNQFLKEPNKVLSITAIGYGRSNGILNTENKMRANGEMILRYKKLETNTNEINPIANTFKIDQLKNKGGVCYGDSGGPALINDPISKKNIIIGVASQVRNDRSGLSAAAMEVDYCNDESLYVNMYYYKKYLKDAIKMAMKIKEKEKKLALQQTSKLN